jgi:hypothetical protein
MPETPFTHVCQQHVGFQERVLRMGIWVVLLALNISAHSRRTG